MLNFWCSFLNLALDQKAMQSWRVIPILCVPKFLKLCAQDRRSFMFRLHLSLGITPEGILKGMHSPFSMGLRSACTLWFLYLSYCLGCPYMNRLKIYLVWTVFIIFFKKKLWILACVSKIIVLFCCKQGGTETHY